MCNPVQDGHMHGIADTCIALLQELGYMAYHGYVTGIISTCQYTWLLKTNRRGDVWVSDAVEFSRQGDTSCVSVTEVDKLPRSL